MKSTNSFNLLFSLHSTTLTCRGRCGRAREHCRPRTGRTLRCSSRAAPCRRASAPAATLIYDNSVWGVGPSRRRVKGTRVEHACLFYSFRVKIQTRVKSSRTGDRGETVDHQLVVMIIVIIVIKRLKIITETTVYFNFNSTLSK